MKKGYNDVYDTLLHCGKKMLIRLLTGCHETTIVRISINEDFLCPNRHMTYDSEK